MTDEAVLERRWLARARDGDAAAFEQLYRATVGQVFGASRRLCRNDAEAEDITQKTYLRAWTRLDSYRGDGRFAAWVRRIAVRLAIDALRARAAEPSVSTEVAAPLPAVERRSSLAAVDLERAVGSLPEGARRVFVLHDFEGFTHAEIAEALSVSVGTSKTQLFRARRALKEWLT